MKSNKWSKKVKFHPWVGDNYRKGLEFDGNHIRVLLLGESHWKTGRNIRSWGCSFTQDSIKSYLAPKGTPGRRWSPSHYWEKTGRLIAGREDYDRSVVWHSLAFCNYLQEFHPVGTKPSKEDYQASDEAFREVKRVLRPQATIVLCKRLWPHVKDLVGTEGFYINHPSYANYKKWHRVVTENLSRILS